MLKTLPLPPLPPLPNPITQPPSPSLVSLARAAARYIFDGKGNQIKAANDKQEIGDKMMRTADNGDTTNNRMVQTTDGKNNAFVAAVDENTGTIEKEKE